MKYKDNESWLITVPHTDINFKSHLEDSDEKTIKKVLKNKNIGKTKRIVLERRLRKLQNEKLRQLARDNNAVILGDF